jgi:hypothetical protein
VPPLTSAASVSLLSVAARLGTISSHFSEAPMVPAGVCCIVEAGGRIVEAAIYGARRAISLVVATVPGAGAAAVPLSAMSPLGKRVPRCAAGARHCRQVCQHS